MRGIAAVPALLLTCALIGGIGVGARQDWQSWYGPAVVVRTQAGQSGNSTTVAIEQRDRQERRLEVGSLRNGVLSVVFPTGGLIVVQSLEPESARGIASILDLEGRLIAAKRCDRVELVPATGRLFCTVEGRTVAVVLSTGAEEEAIPFRVAAVRLLSDTQPDRRLSGVRLVAGSPVLSRSPVIQQAMVRALQVAITRDLEVARRTAENKSFVGVRTGSPERDILSELVRWFGRNPLPDSIPSLVWADVEEAVTALVAAGPVALSEISKALAGRRPEGLSVYFEARLFRAAKLLIERYGVDSVTKGDIIGITSHLLTRPGLSRHGIIDGLELAEHLDDAKLDLVITSIAKSRDHAALALMSVDDRQKIQKAAEQIAARLIDLRGGRF